MRQRDRSRADAGRFGTTYDEGACMATPALELIERANREAAEARLATVGGSRSWPQRRWAAARTLAARVVRGRFSKGSR